MTAAAPAEPAGASPPPAFAPSALRRGSPELVEDERRRPLVLVIEDQGDARERCVTALAGAGFRVRTARTGFEGIVKAAALRPDLILINPSLGGLDGWDTARLLKGCSSTSAIPLVAYVDECSAPAPDAMEAAGFGALIARTDPDERLVREVGALLPIRQ